ncbi:hypothetical protein [Bacteroides oleiciplenus]|uniref:hypothetical protein n=1 Tax=Bacteroides oleiciplenus TaxID=626931 RepID=UPI0012F8DDD1|nr:hypothetical protein [Bacteroides oleiciplenus]
MKAGREITKTRLVQAIPVNQNSLLFPKRIKRRCAGTKAAFVKRIFQKQQKGIVP